MHIAIGDTCSNDQTISVRMVYPPRVCLGENNVFELSPCVLGWLLLSSMHMYLGRGSSIFCVLSRALRPFPATHVPPIMVNTSFILSGLYCRGWSSLIAAWGSSKNSLKCPTLMSLSISSLKATHLSVLCPMSLWKAQFFLTSLCDLSHFIASGCLYRFLSITA